MSEPAPDVDPDRDFRTVPDGHQPGSPKQDSLAADTIDDSPDHPAQPADDEADDEAGGTGSDQDVVRRAAGMKPSKETGQAGSSADRPPALDPD